MKKYILRYKKNLIISVILGILEVYFIYLSTTTSAKLIDIFVGKKAGDAKYIALITILYIALDLISFYISEKNANLFSQNVSMDLRHDYIDALFQSKSCNFYEKNKGDYLADIDQNIDQLRLDYLDTLPVAISGLGTTAIYVIGLYKIHPYILLSTLVFVLLPSLVSKQFSKKISKLQVLRSNKYSTYIDNLNQVIDGYLVIKESSGEKRFLKSFDEEDNNLLNTRSKLDLTQSMFFECMFGINLLSSLLITYVGSLLVKRGYIALSDLVASLLLVSISTNAISGSLRSLVQIKSSGKIKNMVIDKIPEKNLEDEIKTYPELDLKLRDLSLSYGENKIFDSLDLDIEKGKLYAIIGKSGSGKSSLAKILMKINEDYKGDISFENGNFKDFSEKEIYSKIYYIPQNTLVFNDDLKSNISMKDDNIDEERLEEVIKKVDLSYVYESKKDMLLTNDSLSGGEKKKLELARALYRGADLIIFDEPTSSLDPASAYNIEGLIRSLDKLTRIVITHNQDKKYLETFDQVINIEDYK